jgi:hypothetical protein
MKSFKEHLQRKLDENVLDPINKTKSKELWSTSGNLLPDAKRTLLTNFYSWWDKFGFERKDIKKMLILGSITGFQYNEASDIDVNVVVNLSKEKISSVYKLLPGNVKIGKHPCNYYLTADEYDAGKADGVYNVVKDVWEKEVKKIDPKIDNSYVLEVTKFFMDGIDGRIAEYERDKKELDMFYQYLKDADLEVNKNDLEKSIAQKKGEIEADIQSLVIGYHVIKAFRWEAFVKDAKPIELQIQIKSPNLTLNNLIYKTLERFGYFDKLHSVLEKEGKL